MQDRHPDRSNSLISAAILLLSYTLMVGEAFVNIQPGNASENLLTFPDCR